MFVVAADYKQVPINVRNNGTQYNYGNTKFINKQPQYVNTQSNTTNNNNLYIVRKSQPSFDGYDQYDENQYAALNMAEWSRYHADHDDDNDDIDQYLFQTGTKEDISKTKTNIEKKIKELHLELPSTEPQMDTSLSAPLPITAPKTKILIKNEQSEYVNDTNNINSINGDDITPTPITKKGIPSVLKLCTSHSNPAYFRSVHVNHNHHAVSVNGLSPYNLEFNMSDDHTSPSNQSEVTLITPSKAYNVGDKNSQKIEDFDGDLVAYNTWLTCCSIYDETIISFDALYPELIKIWLDKTECERTPHSHEILPIFIRLGGYISNNVHVMRKNKYLKFWKWFKNCLVLMDELKYLWDSFELNLFYQRKDTEKLLNRSVPGLMFYNYIFVFFFLFISVHLHF